MVDLTVDELQQDSWQNSDDKGWHEPREIEGVVRNASSAERIALIHSEASEALEEIREGRYDVWYDHTKDPPKPEGAIVELADLLIRAGDMAGELQKHFGTISLREAVDIKRVYNRTRSMRHGGKNV